jgi:hypothetical protein
MSKPINIIDLFAGPGLGQSGDITMTSDTKPAKITPVKTTTAEQQKTTAIKPKDQERFNKARKALREYWNKR